jgi:hypothetical protein
MDDYKDIIVKLSEATGIQFEPAQLDALDELRSLGASDEIIAFYAAYEPADPFDGEIRFLNIDDIVLMNNEAVPGYCVQPHGYIVFAENDCGDSYCFDMNQLDGIGRSRIVVASPETAEDIETAEQAAAMVQQVAPNLMSFLDLVLRDNVPGYEFHEDE